MIYGLNRYEIGFRGGSTGIGPVKAIKLELSTIGW